jgi:hypothetical protein
MASHREAHRLEIPVHVGEHTKLHLLSDGHHRDREVFPPICCASRRQRVQ